MPSPMTPRSRWLAALRCQPVDRLPFWPKLNGSYALNQAEPFRSMAIPQLMGWVGADPHVGGPACSKVLRAKTCAQTDQRDGVRTTTYRTPAGDLTSVEHFDPTSQSWHPREFPVKTEKDIEAMTLFFADARCEFDPPQVEKAQATLREQGESAVVVTGIGVSPLMDWIQHLAGIENGHYLLADHREKVEALFAAMHRLILRRAEIVAEKCPIQVVYSTENSSTTLISTDQFRGYCMKHLMDYGRILAGAGKLHVLHMCGHLKAFLPDIATLPAAGIEAFTSPTVGNTTLLDGRTACPRTCLIGGTNAELWLHPAEAIIRTIRRDLDSLPHHRGIVVTSAGVMPPACTPQTIRQVAEFVRSYRVGDR